MQVILIKETVVSPLQGNGTTIKSKGPYLTSVTRNSTHYSDKPEADGALVLPPFRYKCSVIRVFEATCT